MMLSFVLASCFCVLGPNFVSATADNPLLSYDFLYNEGVKYYLDEDWGRCVKNLELAIEDWHWYIDNLALCRGKCRQETNESGAIIPNRPFEDQVYEETIRNTLCLITCKRDVFGARMDRVHDKEVNKYFEERKPYDYLQLCYFKMNRIEEAANAAATVLAVQPNHDAMVTNLKYYTGEGGVKPEEVINLEMMNYGKDYIQGNRFYQDQEYQEAIKLFERSLENYYESEQKCRLLCEGPFDQGWFPDFVSSVANHYTFTIRCKRKCENKLGNLFGEEIKEFLASYFNYLQFSYYKVGDIEKATEAVASYLVLDPEDEIQARNKEYYLSLIGITEDDFIPRKDVVEYQQKREYEKRLIEFIETNFIVLNEDSPLDSIEVENKDLEVTKSDESAESLADVASRISGQLDTSKILESIFDSSVLEPGLENPVLEAVLESPVLEAVLDNPILEAILEGPALKEEL